MMRFATLAIAAAVAVLSGLSGPAYAEPQKDPLNSVMWEDMKKQFFAGAKVEFDDRVKVVVPMVLENQAQVPVTADARALKDVRQVIVFADLNPIQHVLTLRPNKAEPYISFRMKVEQGTPVRAAAQTADGVWHVGGVFLDAMGGGCSAPALARNSDDWTSTVGNTRARVWRQADGTARVRMMVRHPMDTGLAPDGTPSFFIEQLEMRSKSGTSLAWVELREPVSEDPTLTMMVKLPSSEPSVLVRSRDNSGSHFRSEIPASWTQSRLGDRARTLR